MGKYFQSVWSKLVLSYLSLVLVIAVLLALIFYLFFSHKYSEEIRINKQLMLNSTVNNIESSVIERVNQIYLSLALDSNVSFNLDMIRGNHSKVLDVQHALQKQVQNHSDVIQAIHLYHNEQKYFISSMHGLQLNNHTGSTEYDPDWIHMMKNSNDSIVWMPTRLVPLDPYIQVSEQSNMTPLISYVHSYPFQSTGKNAEFIIAIDIKQSAISEFINSMFTTEYNQTFIIDQNGIIISAADQSLLGKPSNEHLFVHSLTSINAANKNTTHTYDGESYVVSQKHFAGNEWRIYTATPTKSFYYKMDGLKQNMLVLCLVAIIVGAALSFLFTAKGYKPLKVIMNNIKHKHVVPTQSKQNEFSFIDTAINSLSNKVNSLEETLQVNHSLIKHHIILNMLTNRYSEDELHKQLQSVNISMDYTYYRCMVINPISEKWRERQPAQLQHALYSIIHQLETTKYEHAQLLAEQLQDQKIVVVISSNTNSEQLIDEICNFIHLHINNIFGLQFAIAVGSSARNLADLHNSYNEANRLINYSYLYPELSIIQEQSLLERDISTLELADSYLVNYEKKLQSRDLAGTLLALQTIINTLKDGAYSIEYSRIICLKLVSIYSDCINQLRFQPAEASSLNLYKEYNAIYSVDRYMEWISQLITEFISHVEKRSENRSQDTVVAAKAYIDKHISEDFSLNDVSEHVFISAKYLSKLFKEETGITFSEYVTQQRMQRARELMEQRNLTVEQVANTVGYRTPAYFIKKFKEIHGCTPKTFMRSLMN